MRWRSPLLIGAALALAPPGGGEAVLDLRLEAVDHDGEDVVDVVRAARGQPEGVEDVEGEDDSDKNLSPCCCRGSTRSGHTRGI